MPILPKKYDLAVVEEIKFETVKLLDVVAIKSVPLLPDVRMEFAGKFSVAVSVPAVVTGEFVTVKAEGRERPTDVTEPLPVPVQTPFKA